MKKRTIMAGVVFLLLSLTDVLSIFIGGNDVHLYVKPFLMPSLAAAALCQLLPEHGGRLCRALLSGLCFHTAGDILLLFPGFAFFAAGLGAFLLGHWCYLVVLLSGTGALRGWKEILCLMVPLVLAPVIVGLFGVEWPFSAAVAVYAFTLMMIAAGGVLWKLRGVGFAWRIFWGGIIFMISDSLIALKSFAGIDFALRNALIMPTYLLAEWLLVSGMLRGKLLVSGGSSR